MLIDFDIICSKKMIVDLQKRKLTIVNYDLTISIICTSITFRVNQILRFKQVVIISAHTIMIVSFKFQNDKFDLSIERDYIFQFHVIFINLNVKKNIVTHVMNDNFSFIHVRNATNKLITLSKHIKLSRLFDYDEKNCYYANVFEIHLIVDVNWKRRVLIVLIDVIVTVAFFLVETTFDSSAIFNFVANISQVYAIDSIFSLEIITSNDITIYDISSKIQQRIRNVVKFFFQRLKKEWRCR